LAKLDPDRCVVIDATQPRDLVEARIWRIVSERFGISSNAAMQASAHE
jgi:thymidylate kinase